MNDSTAMTKLRVEVGDITRLPVDAIVNAANSRLAGGGGVDGAIHRAAGSRELQAACRKLGGCPTGEVRVTPGFALPARYIFHAVGPVWHGGQSGEPEQLASCYRHALEEADRLQLRSLAFPAISCGVYRFPPEQAAAIAVQAVWQQLSSGSSVREVIFCCFDEAMAELYRPLIAEPGENRQ